MCISGNGATFDLDGDTAVMARIISIGEYKETVEEIEDNDLNSNIAQYCPGDLIDRSTLDIVVVFDPTEFTDSTGSPNPLVPGKVQTGTLTFPLETQGNTAAKIAGTGFLMEVGFDGLENNTRTEGTWVWRWDGKTGPTWTDEVTP